MSAVDVERNMLSVAISDHRAGKLDFAQSGYLDVLDRCANNHDALHNLAVLKEGQNEPDIALKLFKAALNAKPEVLQLWISYLLSLGRHKKNRKMQRIGAAALWRFKGTEHWQTIITTLQSAGLCSETIVKLVEEAEKPFDLAKSLKIAKGYTQGNDFVGALEVYTDVLLRYPKNRKALKERKKCRDDLARIGEEESEPKKSVIMELNGALSEGKKEYVCEKCVELLESFPRSTTLRNLAAVSLRGPQQGGEAQVLLQEALDIDPLCVLTRINMANALLQNGDLARAKNELMNALVLDHKNSLTLYNLGTVCKSLGDLDAAIKMYRKSLVLAPKNLDAHINLGIAYYEKRQLADAIQCFYNAIRLNADNSEAYLNLAVVYKRKGELDLSIRASRKAIELKPDNPKALTNLGIALVAKAEILQGKDSFLKALQIDPHYAPAYWSMQSTCKKIEDASALLEGCLRADSSHQDAKMFLAALNYIRGNPKQLDAINESPEREHPYIRSFNWVFRLKKMPPLFFNRWQLFEYVVSKCKTNRHFYEYGVWRGEAFSFLIRYFKKGYGFDTFEGIPEDWHHEKVGTYSSEGSVPDIEGGTFIVGKFEDTLPEFFSKKRHLAGLINFDADLYASTICALNFSARVIDSSTILIFDEFLMNKNWEEDEYKALVEFCVAKNYTFEVIAVSFFSKQVAVRLIPNSL